jgi:uncharacterized membrane protein
MSAIISAVLAVAAVIMLILLSFTLFLVTDSSFFKNLPVRPYAYYLIGGISASVALLVISFIFLFKNINAISLDIDEKITEEPKAKGTKGEEGVEDVMKYLDASEREIYGLLVDAGGMILQRDITSVKGYSKATITRILNRLEAKGVIERMRHGTTNQIILKRVSK